jgi:single-stranded-DNA-specific exonuclease
MSLTSKRWEIYEPIPEDIDQALSSHPYLSKLLLLRQILYNRQITNPDAAWEWLSAASPPGTDPFLMIGIPQAVARIETALKTGERLAVYGDYDADGVTATALLVQVLRSLIQSLFPEIEEQTVQALVLGYIPNRFDEGYGLNKEALSNLCQEGIRLVITVDCGIRSIPEAEHARQLGLDLIITDHHHPAEKIPPATAIINPKQPGDPYLHKDLAGVGLAYKLAEALIASFSRLNCPGLLPNLVDYLDLVALGTVADLAPMKGENRSPVRAGLRLMRRSQRQGLQSLMGVAGIRPEKINSWDIGFALGPRLNAAGRLDSALAAFRLLCTQDLHEAGFLAQQLDNQNRERQTITKHIQELAEQIALPDGNIPLLLYAAHTDFNPGVVGLAASRLTDKYYRPAIIAYTGEELTRASCRSIKEFHITDALDQCAELMEHHGGHAAAAGFTIRNERLPELMARLNQIAAEQLAGRDLRPVMKAEAETDLSELTPGLLKSLDALQPTGFDNPHPLFVTRNLLVKGCRTVGKDGGHLKFTVTDGNAWMDAIAFRQGYWMETMPSKVDLLYAFEDNEYNGNSSLQLNVKDIKPSGNDDSLG